MAPADRAAVVRLFNFFCGRRGARADNSFVEIDVLHCEIVCSTCTGIGQVGIDADWETFEGDEYSVGEVV